MMVIAVVRVARMCVCVSVCVEHCWIGSYSTVIRCVAVHLGVMLIETAVRFVFRVEGSEGIGASGLGNCEFRIVRRV